MGLIKIVLRKLYVSTFSSIIKRQTSLNQWRTCYMRRKMTTATRLNLLNINQAHIFREASYNQYTAPYPHWIGTSSSKSREKPGVLALLVSPSQGILEVKRHIIDPFMRGCKQNGEKCSLGTTCHKCCVSDDNWRAKGFEHQCGAFCSDNSQSCSRLGGGWGEFPGL